MTSSLLSAELLKVRKRWLIYVLFLVMIAGVSIHVWLAGYGSWVNDDPEFRQQALHSFVLPWALASLLDSGQFWGALLIGILTASVVATEYNWGTVRQALVRGQTRSDYLTVKLVAITIASTALMLTTLAIGIGMAVIATAVAGEPITFDAPGGPSAVEAVVMVLRAAYCVLPYGLLAFMLAVVGRSTTLGVAGIVLYIIVESIMVAMLGELGGPAPTIRAFFIGLNASAVLSANNIGGVESYNSMAFRELPDPSRLPDPWAGAFALAIWCIVLLVITYVIFQRRDLTSGAGGT